MTTSESKGRFFLQNESIRIDSHNESNRIDSKRELECSYFQPEGADTEKAREEKLLVIPAGLVRRFALEERKVLVGR